MLLLLLLLFSAAAGELLPADWLTPPLPIMEVMAAAKAAVKLGSAVIAAVAALTVSTREGCCAGACCWWCMLNWAVSMLGESCRPENLDWL